MSIVTNLATGATAEYARPPERAVVLAYRQLTVGDYNWWAYPSPEPMLREGEYTWACGDWCAMKQSADNERSA